MSGAESPKDAAAASSATGRVSGSATGRVAGGGSEGALEAPAERPGMRRGPGGMGPHGGMGMPVEKAKSFGPSAKRLVGRLAPERAAVLVVLVLGIIAVVLNVLGPKILGNATNIIVDGVITRQGIDFPALQVVLGGVLVLYVFASVFSFLQAYVLNGVTQRTG